MSDIDMQIAQEMGSIEAQPPKGKSNSVVTTELVDAEGRPTESVSGAVGIRFHVRAAGSTTLWLRKLSEPNRQRGMVHGLIQRVSDRAAKSRDTKTGLPVPASEKLKAMAILVEHLNSGSDVWELRTAAQPRVDSRIENLLTALRQLGFVTNDAGEAKVRGMTVSQRAAIALRDDVAVELRRIESAQTTEIDTDDLLAGLE